jgi:acetyltransferase-like isoleucine patch superfamily enzyme
MRKLMRRLRSWLHGFKFAKKGKGCRFQGTDLQIEGHVEVGSACRFRDHLIMRTHGKGKIVFGSHSGCSYYCIIEAEELVQIGNATAITEFCVIRDTNHLIYGTDAHWAFTPHITRPIIIGDNVFVGSRSYIHPGVTIEEGAIIGVGSVLIEGTHVGPYEIWAGVPARKIGHRTENVPPARLQEAQELLARDGVREDRYKGKLY